VSRPILWLDAVAGEETDGGVIEFGVDVALGEY
jgi:hypothetical protein